MSTPNGITNRFQPLEIGLGTNSASLGFRFWDHALDIPVTDNLIVTARPVGGPRAPVMATPTDSGIYLFRNLPGLPHTITPQTTALPFLVEVHDRIGRFQPVALELDLPYQGSGLFQDVDPAGQVVGKLGQLDLYSAPTRRLMPGLAKITGQLWDQAGKGPAAFAMLGVQFGPTTWYGMADQRGCFALVFPYPVMRPSVLAPADAGVSLQHFAWNVTLSVRYGDGAWSFPPGSPVPDLRAIKAQPASRMYPSARDAPVAEWGQTVQFRQELVLRTDQTSVLLIDRGTTPVT